jgi:hypothetical protein
VTIDASALRRQASAVSHDQLVRARGRLRDLSRSELEVVEETVHAVGLGVAACLLDSAAADEGIEAVLAALYPSVGSPSARG